MLDFLAEFLIEMLGSFLWSAFSQEQGRLGESRIERQGRYFWHWVFGIVALLVVVAAVYVWSSHRL